MYYKGFYAKQTKKPWAGWTIYRNGVDVGWVGGTAQKWAKGLIDELCRENDRRAAA